MDQNPKFPTRTFNKQSARMFIRLNKLGEFIKLEHFTLLKHKFKFARIYINVDITKRLITSSNIPRNGGVD